MAVVTHKKHIWVWHHSLDHVHTGRRFRQRRWVHEPVQASADTERRYWIKRAAYAYIKCCARTRSTKLQISNDSPHSHSDLATSYGWDPETVEELMMYPVRLATVLFCTAYHLLIACSSTYSHYLYFYVNRRGRAGGGRLRGHDFLPRSFFIRRN